MRLTTPRGRAGAAAGSHDGAVHVPLRESAVGRLARASALDASAEALQRAVRRLVPLGSVAKDVASGTWLGHPAHPPLTDLVVGTWTGATLLDLAGGRRGEDAADALLGAGVVAALPTALSGLSDFAELRGGPRRIALVHAAANTTALALQALSLGVRRAGRRRAGVALSAGGTAVVGISAWLGGHLSFTLGVGVNQAAFEELPEEWTAAADEGDLEDGGSVRVRVGGARVLLVRHRGAVHALADRCTHRGCSLGDGTIEGGTVTCPCHGSTFALDGTVLRGPATAPQPALDARVRDERIEVRRRAV